MTKGHEKGGYEKFM